MASKGEDAARQIESQLKNSKALEQSGIGYLKTIADLGEQYKAINQLQKEQEASEAVLKESVAELKKLKQGIVGLTGEELKNQLALIKAKKIGIIVEKESRNLIKEQVKLRKAENVELEKTIKSASKYKTIINATQNGLNASSKFIRTGLLDGFKSLTRSGAMGWAQDIQDAQLNMGITSKHSKSFAKSISYASLSTSALGVNAGALAKAQGAYSDELGRAVELGQEGLIAVSEMGAATGIGAEGAAKMVSELDKFNLSAVGVRDIIQETVDSATVMGLNSSKVVKTMQGNLKLSQKYHFKGGIKGIASMAAYATKMGISMDAMGGAADKAFRPEGAVEMAARLQTMGGAFSKIADPFTLMFKARNDFEGFSKDMGKAAAELATFNSESGEFEISGLQLDRLKEISDMTGIAQESLSQMALQGAKFNRIKQFLPPMMSEEDGEMISNLAVADENGGYKVKIGVDAAGMDKFEKVNKLTDKQFAKVKKEKESLELRAKNSQTFMKKWGNLMDTFQTLLLPIINKLTEYLEPMIEKFQKAMGGDLGKSLMGISSQVGELIGSSLKKVADGIFGPEFFTTMKDMAVSIGGFVKTVSKFVAENPTLTAALVGVLTLGGPIMMLGTGIISLVKGIGSFMGGMRGLMSGGGGGGGMFGGDGGGGGGGGRRRGRRRGGRSRGRSRGGRGGGGMGALGMGLGMAGMAAYGAKGFTEEGSAANTGLDIFGDAAMGASMGAMLGPWGMAAGAVGGLGYGMYNHFGKKQEGTATGGVSLPGYAMGTSNITKPGFGLVGENGPEITQMSKGTKVHPTDSEFSMSVNPIKIDGTIRLEGGGQTLDNNLLKDPLILREITRLVQEGIRSATGGGKLSPST